MLRDVVVGGVHEGLVEVDEQDELTAAKQVMAILGPQALGLLHTNSVDT